MAIGFDTGVLGEEGRSFIFLGREEGGYFVKGEDLHVGVPPANRK